MNVYPFEPLASRKAPPVSYDQLAQRRTEKQLAELARIDELEVVALATALRLIHDPFKDQR